MLLIAAAAVWVAYFTGLSSIKRDLAAIEMMHQLAPELYVRNPSEYACLTIDRTDDIREFRCYLPPGHSYKLQLHWSKDFKIQEVDLEPEESVEIANGKHEILLNELPNRLTISLDGKEVIDVPRVPIKSRGTMSTGATGTFNEQWAPWKTTLPLLTLREVESGKTIDANQPGPGIRLWIESSE